MDTTLPTDTFALVPRQPAAVEPRGIATLGFLLRYMARTPGLSNHQAVVERLRGELEWSRSEWRRLNPFWGGYDHEAELEAAADRLPHEQAAAEALNCWSHTVAHSHRLRECIIRLRAQREYGWAQVIATAEDIRAHLQNRRTTWRAFLVALRRYRELRAVADPGPSNSTSIEELSHAV